MVDLHTDTELKVGTALSPHQLPYSNHLPRESPPLNMNIVPFNPPRPPSVIITTDTRGRSNMKTMEGPFMTSNVNMNLNAIAYFAVLGNLKSSEGKM
ncbi:hypothetical protein CPB84DRAFT_1795153 [Gymnopilus junonius]|uniref:Uncharacterized protein n=1 Tax=Gymnopilus junonius TaxID=109634 RepID=A0A9P5NCG6_GYMJU|nr:hypothetical protein CPB84DRAFT_1795153 [Gymnopilus junonius]